MELNTIPKDATKYNKTNKTCFFDTAGFTSPLTTQTGHVRVGSEPKSGVYKTRITCLLNLLVGLDTTVDRFFNTEGRKTRIQAKNSKNQFLINFCNFSLKANAFLRGMPLFMPFLSTNQQPTFTFCKFLLFFLLKH